MKKYDTPRKQKAKEEYDARVAEAKRAEEARENGDFGDEVIRAERMPVWEEGESRTLRIIPAKDAMRFYLDNSEEEDIVFEDEAYPVQELCTHFKVGPKKAIIPCDSFYNDKPCAVDDEIKELKASGDEDDAKYASDMYAGHRFARFVLWRDNPKNEPLKVWAWEVSKTTDTDVIALYMNNKIQELDLMWEGMDIEVTRHGVKKETKYRVEDVREESYIVETEDGEFDYEAVEKIYANLPNIFEYNLPFLSYDEVKEVVNGLSVKDVIKARYADATEAKDAPKPEEEDKPKRGRGRK